MLQVAGLHKSYGRIAALVDVHLHIAAGEIVGLLGHNGAGKTTLLSIVAGLRRPDAGSVLVGGVDAVKEPGQARQLLGLAPQDLGIYPPLTVHSNLRFFGELAGLGRRVLAERISEVAAGLDLEGLLDRQAGQLSGGEKRRVHTAIALIHRPPLLLLDEPTAGADIATRSRLLALLRSLADEGVAVCCSTHYLPEAERLNASVAILEQGHLIARGTLDELIKAHGSCLVELVFKGQAPSVPGGEVVPGDPSRLRLPGSEPAAVMAAALAALGPDAERLATAEIVRPSLESVYLTLTGRRFEVGPAPRTIHPGGERGVVAT